DALPISVPSLPSARRRRRTPNSNQYAILSPSRGAASLSQKLNSPFLHDYVTPLMNLTELKQKPITDLLEMAEQMGIENMARSRKQDVIFALLKKHAKSGEEISGDGVLEILQDGFGFLRSADASYLAGADDISDSRSQIRRFNLRTGDTIVGKIRPPKEGERYFALLKVDTINFVRPENAKNKILF